MRLSMQAGSDLAVGRRWCALLELVLHRLQDCLYLYRTQATPLTQVWKTRSLLAYNTSDAKYKSIMALLTCASSTSDNKPVGALINILHPECQNYSPVPVALFEASALVKGMVQTSIPSKATAVYF